MLWTPRQRGTLALLITIILAALFIRLRFNSAHIDSPQTDQGQRAAEAISTVDPNTADWPTLAALPSIGPALAKRIVEDRDAFAEQHPGQPAYRQPNDLLQVKGIGPAIIQAVAPHLSFSVAPSTTMPTSR
jgi:competence protein ComEA